MRMRYFILAAALLVGCDSAAMEEAKDLRGTWTIAHSERTLIRSDGTTEVFEDITDAGTLEIVEGGDSDLFTDFQLSFRNFRGETTTIVGQLSVDETTDRVLLGRTWCGGGLFNCTLVMNVIRDRDNEQIWHYFYTNVAGALGQYDPTLNDEHYRWQLTLRR